jgi:hypothetical protein
MIQAQMGWKSIVTVTIIKYLARLNFNKKIIKVNPGKLRLLKIKIRVEEDI